MFLHVCLTSSCNLAILLSLFLLASSPETAHAVVNRESVIARHGVVVTDETECSRIGTNILRQGGHAVDAAVAAALCLGVVSPSYSGIGGGGFMLVRLSSGGAKVFDMREMAPGRATVDMFGPNVSKYQFGPLSIAVPGQIAGLYTAHKQYGKIPWETLVKPAENLARIGFKISQSLSDAIYNSKAFIKADKDLWSIFAPKGKLLREGKTIRFIKLADTLASISTHGMDIFYRGSIAKSLAEDIQKAGGIMTKEDFQRYRVISRKPLVANVLGHQLVTAPPPASGGAVMILVGRSLKCEKLAKFRLLVAKQDSLGWKCIKTTVQILKILSNYNSTGDSIPLGLREHRLIEALKFALALRTDLGDPGFVNATDTLEKMISTGYAKKLMNLINDKVTFGAVHYGSKWSQIYDHGTTHVCVVDDQRNVVTMTLSLNSHFGSKMVSPSTGIFLNNQIYDFSVPTWTTPPPSPANFVEPFKRPLSSMAPTILLKGTQIKAVIGAAGGLLIPDAVAQVLLNHLNLNMDPLVAVRYPRLYHMLYPNVLYYEEYKPANGGKGYKFKSKFLKELKKKGHVLKRVPGWTICQFVLQQLEGPDSGQLIAVSDLRKGGSPAGY